jgi:hypothetical protein
MAARGLPMPAWWAKEFPALWLLYIYT